MVEYRPAEIYRIERLRELLINQVNNNVENVVVISNLDRINGPINIPCTIHYLKILVEFVKSMWICSTPNVRFMNVSDATFHILHKILASKWYIRSLLQKDYLLWCQLYSLGCNCSLLHKRGLFDRRTKHSLQRWNWLEISMHRYEGLRLIFWWTSPYINIL